MKEQDIKQQRRKVYINERNPKQIPDTREP